MREIEVLGVPLKERSVRESMRRVDEMFESGALGMIGLITMKGIMAAGESEEIKKFIGKFLIFLLLLLYLEWRESLTYPVVNILKLQ